MSTEDLDTLLLATILAEDVGTIANIIQAAAELSGTMSERLSSGYYEMTNKDPDAETDIIGLIDPDEARQLLAEVQAEPEIECAHCGKLPDGTLDIHTTIHERSHRICEGCAELVLRWL